MSRTPSLLVAIVVTATLVATTGAATDIGGKCSSVKLKAAAKKSGSKLKCHATAYARGVPVDQAASNRRIHLEPGAQARAVRKRDRRRCGGSCPFGLNCFEIGVGCFGDPEPCRCHGSTTTCPLPHHDYDAAIERLGHDSPGIARAERAEHV